MATRRRSKPKDLAVARLSGTAANYANRPELDVDAAVAALRAVPAVTPEHLAETAGVILGAHRSDMDFDQQALKAALLIAAGADLSRLRHWIKVGQQRASRRAHFSPD